MLRLIGFETAKKGGNELALIDDFDELFKCTLSMFSIDPTAPEIVRPKEIQKVFNQVCQAHELCWDDFKNWRVAAASDIDEIPVA